MVEEIAVLVVEVVLEGIGTLPFELLGSTPATTPLAASIGPSARPRSFQELEARLLNHRYTDEVRLEALRQLSASYPGPDSERVVAQALLDSSPEVRTLALQVLTRFDAKASYATVARVKGATAEEQAALAAALAKLGGSKAQLHLLRLLDTGTGAGAISAARALGSSGNARAIERLLPHSQAWLGGELTRAADLAIRAIRAREGLTSQPGALSVSAAAGGEVTMAAPPGSLSRPGA